MCRWLMAITSRWPPMWSVNMFCNFIYVAHCSTRAVLIFMHLDLNGYNHCPNKFRQSHFSSSWQPQLCRIYAKRAEQITHLNVWTAAIVVWQSCSQRIVWFKYADNISIADDLGTFSTSLCLLPWLHWLPIDRQEYKPGIDTPRIIADRKSKNTLQALLVDCFCLVASMMRDSFWKD